MSGFPSAIKTYRAKLNLPGVTFETTDKRTLFVEDVTALETEITAIETELGTNPKGAKTSVKARLDDVDAAIVAVKSALYPVGTVYTNVSNSTNPGTLLGFGTWEALAGRVLVGKAASGTFGTAGATGGEETHVLTITEMPSHHHDNGIDFGSGGGSKYGGLDRIGDSPNNCNTSDTGGGGAHNNLQPYIVVYMWKRTA